MNEVLVKMMQELCETFLRTKHGLGYVIEIASVEEYPTYGLTVTVNCQFA